MLPHFDCGILESNSYTNFDLCVMQKPARA